MFTAKQLPNAIRFALIAGAASTAGFASTAFAQQQDEAATLERIQVTGSRISRVDLETVSPVTVLDRAQIEASGLQTVGDVLRSLSQADALGLTNVTSSTNANDGTQTVSLRGLGAARTLVLVNGRRWISSGGGTVDTSTIPTAIVERVEVLTDGASAVYGSDAIAGVINLILRDNYEGAEANFSVGQSSFGDGEVTRYGVTVGASSDRARVMFNIDKVEQKEIMAGDRDISRFPVQFVPDFFGSAFGQFGVFNVPGLGFVHLNPEREGASEPRTPADFNPGFFRYNFAPTNFLLTPSDRLSAFSKASFDLTDNIRAFGQFNFNQRKSVTQIAEVPITNFFSGPQWEIPIAANNAYNPFGQEIRGSGMRMSALGPRTNFQNYDTYFLTVGLDGFFNLGNRAYDWETYFSRGESSLGRTGDNYVNLFNLRAGLGPSFFDANGVARCGTPGAVIANCVPVNFFDGQSGFTPEMLNYIGYSLAEKLEFGVTNWGVNFSGELFDLPAGAAAFAAGYEYRKNTIVDQPDSLVAIGGSSNNFREPTSGTQQVDEYYLELNIPLLADVPAFQRLELVLAGRSSDYTNSGFIGTTPDETSFDNDSFRYGLTWKVFDDLLIRANYGDTFRAPSVSQLYGGGGEGFPAATDPCSSRPGGWSSLSPTEQQRCIAQGVPVGGSVQPTSQVRSLSGGNPALLPEKGYTKTLGVVYNPSWFDGFDMSVDWFQYTLGDALAFLGAGGVFSNCIRDNATAVQTEADRAQFCNLIERANNGDLETVRTGSFNLAAIEVEGYDLRWNYRFGTGFGDFALRSESTYTASAKTTTGDLATATQLAGRAVGAFGFPTWRIRSNLNLQWSYADFGVNYGVRYFSGIIEDCQSFVGLFADGLATRQLCSDPDRRTATGPAARNRLGGTTYHDASAHWNAPWNATVRVGVRNLWNKQPPFSVSSFANSFYDSYDIPGRYYTLSYTQRF